MKTPALATVFLMTYNQEDYVQKAIISALNQTYSPLEIIISDDASTDSTWDIVQKEINIYRGQHRIHIRRNTKNMGINRHFNEIMKHVNGEYIIAMAGDDISLPNRVGESIQVIQEESVSGMFSNAIVIDGSGREIGIYNSTDKEIKRYSPESILSMDGNGGSGFSFSWRRKDLEVFGEIPSRPIGEDAFLPFRCALINGLVYFNSPLVKYRKHGENVSFWNQYKRAKGRNSKKAIIQKSLLHYLSMYECWAVDLNKVEQSRNVTTENKLLINYLINYWIAIYRWRIAYLDKGFIRYFVHILTHVKAYKKNIVKKPILKEIRWYLSSMHPRKFTNIKYVYDKLSRRSF
jgi:glycosyltransferase involved in cell wall biosynthesis